MTTKYQKNESKPSAFQKYSSPDKQIDKYFKNIEILTPPRKIRYLTCFGGFYDSYSALYNGSRLTANNKRNHWIKEPLGKILTNKILSD